jgi:uncharacterized membrane protein YhaH (DUF805 family)
MGFTQAVTTCYSRYVQFSGRASRSEYWFFWLFCCLALLAAMVVDAVLGLRFSALTGPAYVLVALANFLPSISVSVRRLHDTDRSGWWYWIILIPIVGAILLIVWFCTRGRDGDNRFGRDPLHGQDVLAPA